MSQGSKYADLFRLSPAEFEVLSELTSRQFGYVRLDEEANLKKKKTAVKTVALLEQELARGKRTTGKKQEAEEGGEGAAKEASFGQQGSSLPHVVPPTIYKKLGHLHLLLENFTRALSAYEKYAEAAGRAARRDLDFLYGRGLVYFHFGAYHLACRTFQILLYLRPNYDCAGDIHARLGLMRKSLQSFRRGITHFKIALRCCRNVEGSSSSPFSEAQIHFHMAHLYEVHGKFSKAMKMYRALLSKPDISVSLQADVHRQIGWIFYSGRGQGGGQEEDKNSRVHSAIQHLQKSLELDPKSGQCLYLLGRCYASIGKVHEAFIAYRNSVDKSESNADTWCSIGVLYQQQNQPMDALQAYICAVQLEKFHGPAWTNLGMLYESTHQFQDALTCYTNAATKCQYTNPLIQQRIKYLKAQLSNVMMPPPPAQQASPYKMKSLPAVEEAWNLPVSNEMTGRHSSKAGKQTDPRRAKEGDKVAPLTSQQMQTLNYLQTQASLTPQQQQVMQQLQQQLNLYKQYQARSQQQAGGGRSGGSEENKAGEPMEVDSQGKGDVGVSEGDLEALISQQDIGSFAQDLLKEIQRNDKENDEQPDKEEASVDKEPTMDVLEIPTKLTKIPHDRDMEAEGDMKGDDIVQKCKQWMNSRSTEFVPKFRTELPSLPKLPPTKLSKEQLLPPTPSVHLENKKDAFSPQLQHFCLEHPIAVIRGIAGALKLDLGLFSTKCVAETNPSQPMQVVTQVKQKSDENWDISFSKQVWLIESKRSNSTIADYSAYQSAVFQEGLREEKTSKADFDDPREEAKRNRKSQMYVQIATCPDISDVRNWKLQLTELQKLPAWARVVSGGNMLSHVGYPIPGANTVSLHMKVPCSRLGARQDLVNFSSVNINIGPGDCEWFAVPYEYWSSLLSLCERHNVDFLHDSWWPNMKDLMDKDIPVYRFLQRPGDMVWVNAGCVYWVHASGWCNSIKWNVGPLSHYQYQMAMQKWRWNRLQFVKTVVPMVHLSWNLARNIKMSEEGLFVEVKRFLFESLKEFVLLKEHLRMLDVNVSPQHRKKGDQVYFCSACDDEIFGLLFLEEEGEEDEGKGEEGGEDSLAAQTICCFSCAKMKSAAFKEMVCIEEQNLQELVGTYDSFKLQSNQGLGMHAAAAAAAAGFPTNNPAAAAAAYAAAMPFNNLLSFC